MTKKIHVPIPFPWQRLILSLLGIFILFVLWRWSANHLYTLPKDSISAFVTITVNISYSISAIVIFMVAGKLLYDWKNVSNITSSIQEAITRTNIPGNPAPK